jgi:transposase
MYKQGYKQQDIANALGLTQPGVSQIISRAKTGGEEALRQRKPPGAPPRMTATQKAELLTKLAQGAESFGFSGDVWTTPRIAQLIAEIYRVHYHPDYIGPLLRSLGWSHQRPEVRAQQRDEAAIAGWLEKRWPELKKSH